MKTLIRTLGIPGLLMLTCSVQVLAQEKELPTELDGLQRVPEVTDYSLARQIVVLGEPIAISALLDKDRECMQEKMLQGTPPDKARESCEGWQTPAVTGEARFKWTFKERLRAYGGATAAMIILTQGTSSSSCIGGTILTPHKAVHFGGTALVSALGTAGAALLMEDLEWGVALGTAVGVARERYKIHHKTNGRHDMRCEWPSMAADLAGVVVGTETAAALLRARLNADKKKKDATFLTFTSEGKTGILGISRAF